MTSDDPVHGYGWNTADRWGGWSWREPSRGEHFRRCSFCGSIHPDDLAAEPTWRAEWADRKYGWPHKFYVNIANRSPDALFVIGSASHLPDRGEWVAWDDVDGVQRAALDRDGYTDRADTYRPAYLQFGTRPHHYGKFYTVHLADPRVSDVTKDTIAGRSGLRFTFVGGQVRWEVAAPVVATPASPPSTVVNADTAWPANAAGSLPPEVPDGR